MPEKPHQAATAELRQFLSQMRGKSPKEMLGAVASSNLVQSTVTATAAITAAIIVFTVVPFGWKKAFGKSAAAAVAAPAEVQDPSKPLATPPEPSLDGPRRRCRQTRNRRIKRGARRRQPSGIIDR